MSHLDTLNEAQKRAVTTIDGPLMVIAGAGTGKTRVITHRILHLITQGVLPEKILGITFTNKAAGEMRLRVDTLIGFEVEKPRTSKHSNFPTNKPLLCTFHSLGVRMLREHHSAAKIPRQFAIFDRDDSIRALKDALRDEGIDPKQFAPSLFLTLISRYKGDGVALQDFSGFEHDRFGEMLLGVWERYETTLHSENAFDFDDLLLVPLRILQRAPAILAEYQNRWSHLHIDEYQDTNRVQYELSRLLADTHKNICVVGDMDQSIYGWRGARIRNMLQFERDFPGTTVIPLEENYRSTDVILSAANAVIEKNKVRAPKTLFTRRKKGEKIGVSIAANEGGEAAFVAATAAAHIAAGTPPSEIAVLYRTNFQSRVLEEAFLATGIPYQVVGTRFFERKEVRDALAYLHAALNPKSPHHLKRIANVPPRGIGKVTLLKVFMKQEASLPERTRRAVADLRTLLARIQKQAETQKPSAVMRYVIQESGMEALFTKGSEEDEERFLNLKEMVSLASRYDSLPHEEALQKFLEDAALASDQDALNENREAVKLMTVHAAKGLEFSIVFVTGLEEGLFPHEKNDSESPEDQEEERRLFYVALTRAKEKLYLSHAATRRIYGTTGLTVPSQFLGDIDETLLDYADENNGDDRAREELITIDW